MVSRCQGLPFPDCGSEKAHTEPGPVATASLVEAIFSGNRTTGPSAYTLGDVSVVLTHPCFAVYGTGPHLGPVYKVNTVCSANISFSIFCSTSPDLHQLRG